jgi:hypothetical protein
MQAARRFNSFNAFRGLCVAGLAATFGAAGCGSDAPMGASNVIQIVYPVLYSAYDPNHTYKVPVTVPSLKNLTWSVSDSNIAEIEQYEDEPEALGSDAMVTTKGPGTVKIRASAGGVSGEATLTVTAGTSSLWEIGRARYQDGPRIRNDIPDNKAACTNCHGNGGADVEHTPAQTGGYSDAELITIFTMGQKPAGVKNRILSVEAWSPIHRWQMTEEEKQGIVLYLRSLEPQSHGTQDFGGRGVFRMPRGNGGGGNRDGGGGGGNRDGGGGRGRGDGGMSMGGGEADGGAEAGI